MNSAQWFIITIMILLWGCVGTTDVGDGSEIGNPKTICCKGELVNTSGAVDGVEVYLYKADANPVKDSAVAVTTTDENGEFSFNTLLPEIHYRIFSGGEAGSRNSLEMAYLDTLIVGNDTTIESISFEKPATITITDSILSQEQGTVIYAEGLPLFQTVSADTITLLLPAGVVNLAHYNPQTDSLVPNGITFKNIQLSSNESIEVPDAVIGTISTPFGVVGNGVVGVEYKYKISPVSISLNYDVEYRIAQVNYDSAIVKDSDYWNLATIREWGRSTTLPVTFDYPGKNKIRVQARSVQDTTVISEWSNYTAMIVTIE